MLAREKARRTDLARLRVRHEVADRVLGVARRVDAPVPSVRSIFLKERNGLERNVLDLQRVADGKLVAVLHEVREARDLIRSSIARNFRLLQL